MKVESWCHWECRSCCTKIGINKLVSGGCWANGNDITKLAEQEHQGSFSKLRMWCSIVKRGQSMSRTQSSTGVKKKDVMKRENSPKIFPGATGDEIEGLFLLPSSPVYNFSCFICAKKAFTTLPLFKTNGFWDQSSS